MNEKTFPAIGGKPPLSCVIADAEIRHLESVKIQEEKEEAVNEAIKRIAEQMIAIQNLDFENKVEALVKIANAMGETAEDNSVSEAETVPSKDTETPDMPEENSHDLVIARYGPFNRSKLSVPWAAPCNGRGSPIFNGKRGHFEGSPKNGGLLIADSPNEKEIWAYGQKLYYAHGKSPIYYAIFKNGRFHKLDKGTVKLLFGRNTW